MLRNSLIPNVVAETITLPPTGRAVSILCSVSQQIFHFPACLHQACADSF